MDLETLAGEIVEYAGALVGVAEQQPTVTTLKELPNRLAQYYRSLGILGLLTSGDPDPFFHGLIQSGVTRRWYLQRCRAEGWFDEPARRSSIVDPFFDAVAADQLPLARDIADASPAQWMEGFEYEDDFAYARCLFELVASDERSAAIPPLLAQWEAALEGGDDPRLAVVQALFTRDQAGFDDAFVTLRMKRERTLAEVADPKLDSIQALEYNFEPNRRIWVEGLALLRIAELRGLRTASEYPGCPAIARRYDYAPFEPISYPMVSL